MQAAARRTAVITGASSGVGKETALQLAGAGWNVIALGRDPERCQATENALRAAASPGADVAMIAGDLASLADTARMAGAVLARTDRIHALLNNAGGVRDRLLVTPEGNEATFAGNHLGHFLLTKELLPTLRATAAEAGPGLVRVVSTSSEGHRQSPAINWDELQQTSNWISGRNYCLAKLCNLLFTLELARRERANGIVAHAMHPGEVASNFAAHAVPEMQSYMDTLNLLPPEISARTLAWLASAPEAGGVTGLYFHDFHPLVPAPAALDEGAAARLWVESDALLAQVGF